MNNPAIEMPVRMRAFRNKYAAAVIIALVFLSSSLHAQSRIDTIHQRPTIGTNLGMKYLFVESAYGIKAGTDTSTRLALKDSNTLVIYKGTAFVWTNKSGVLRWDSLQAKGGAGGSGGVNGSIGAGTRIIIDGTNQVKKLGANRYIKYDSTSIAGTIIPIFDTANVFHDIDSTHPGKIQVDQSGILRVGGVKGDSLYNLPVTGGSGQGPVIYPLTIDAMKLDTASDGLRANTKEYHTGNGISSGAQYVFVLGSSATADDRLVLTGVGGRWFYIPVNNRVNTSQVGILPGATDYTTILNSVTPAAAALGAKVFFDRAGTYLITPAVTGGIQFVNDYDKWDGIGADSVIIMATAYTGQNKTMLGAANGTRKKGISITNLTFDNGQRFANHAFAAGNPSPDSTARVFYMEGFDGLRMNNLRIKGGSFAGIDFRNTINAVFDRIYVDSCGRLPFTNQYDTLCHDVTISHSRSDYYGLRWHWDFGASKVRNGDDFWQGQGSKNMKLLYDTAVNGGLNVWEAAEGLGYGTGDEIAYCLFDGKGKNCMGLSMGGDPYDSVSTGGIMQRGALIHDNTQINIASVKSILTSDSTTYFSPNFLEVAIMDSTQFYNNNWQNCHVFSGNNTRRVTFKNDIFKNDSSLNTLVGESIFINAGTSNLTTHDTTEITFDGCTITMGGGELMRANSGTTVVNKLAIINSKVSWSQDMIGMELYAGQGGALPKGVSLKNSTLSGKAGTWIYTSNTGSPINVAMDSTDLRLSTVDVTAINNGGHTSPVVSTNGFNPASLILSGSNVQQAIGSGSNFTYKTLFTVPTGGGGTTSYQTQTASGSTTFTFTSVPASYNDYIVYVNGMAIRPTTDYTTSGNVITISTIVTGDIVRFQQIK